MRARCRCEPGEERSPRGKIGEDKNDDHGSDTRWVTLQELVNHVPDATLDATLEKYLDDLKATLQHSVRELRALRDAEDPPQMEQEVEQEAFGSPGERR